MAALSGPFERPRQLVGQVLQRGIEGGEVRSDCDVELIADALIGLNIVQLLRGGAPDRNF